MIKKSGGNGATVVYGEAGATAQGPKLIGALRSMNEQLNGSAHPHHPAWACAAIAWARGEDNYIIMTNQIPPTELRDMLRAMLKQVDIDLAKPPPKRRGK